MSSNAVRTAALPDFVIVGAMKAGTTSLHAILAAHPDVFIPDDEIFFFDLDDPENHHEFQVAPDGSWQPRDFDANLDRNLAWYASHFEGAPPNATVGEDSTTYLVSPEVPERMARVLESPRIVVMMRDPVDRAYSHYWHLLYSGRATLSFTERLRRKPHGLLKFGFYRRHLERYLKVFDREDIKCVVFERFIDQTQEVVDEVCDFLGLGESVPIDTVDTHQNPARIPRSLWLKRWLNNIDPTREEFRYATHLPGGTEPDESVEPLRRIRRWAHDLLDRAAMVGARNDYPPMDQGTRDFLTTLFRRRNDGLSELVERDLTEWWSIWDR